MAHEPLSPDWWVSRLYSQLVARRDGIDFYDAYYTGNHPLPWLAPQARDEFRRILAMTRSNYMGLVCDATAERITIEGFRFGDGSDADDDTWRIFQANNLDSDSDQSILEALISGQSYLLVAPNPRDASLPHVWVEHASQAIVEFEPGSNRRVRAAGLKVWDDDWTGELHATLYLPDAIHKFKARRPTLGSAQPPQWEQRAVAGERWPAANPLGVVPLIEVPNNPRLLTGGVSELSDVTDIQDRVNKTLADRLITQDYGAFPQKWAVAWPQYVDDAQTVPTPPIDVGRDRMVTTEIAETKFGQWESAPLDPYSSAKREDVKDIASRTRTPAQYLLGEMSNVNGETLKASESGLVSKVKQRRRPYAEAYEEAMRLARGLAGLSTDADARMETIFANPEFRTEGELVDALVKMRGIGLPLDTVWERWGATPTERARWRDLLEQEGNDPFIAQVARDLAAPVTGATAAGAAGGAAAVNG